MNDHHIDQLLRRKPPTVEAPSSLEMRIRTRLRSEVYTTAPSVRWQWIALPAAALLVIVAVLQPGEEAQTPPAVVEAPETLEEVVPAVNEELPLIARNPLSSEARALRRDAERTGRFLVDCLPSLTKAK